MATRAKALLVQSSEQGGAIRELLRSCGLRPRPHDAARPASPRELSETDVAVVSVDWGGLNGQRERVLDLIRTLARHNIATLVVGVPDGISFDSPLVEHVPVGASREDIAVRLGAMSRLAPVIRRLDRELAHLQRLGKRLNHHFADIDQEMRLAGRLQRDFLPRQLPQVPPLRFEALYRPATWVSGDIFDVFRVDERHVGMFVGDAVGHGVAAGLLTMFIRQSLRTKRIGENDYDVLEPADAMRSLHETLVKQSLPNCWFVTACYLVVDTTSLEVRHARGGHPFPLHVSPAGQIRELRAGGGLLGVADVGADFEQDRVALNAGDKLIVYSDGLEKTFIESRDMRSLDARYTPQLLEWSRLPARALVEQLGENLDRQEGSLHPADDATLVVMEVAR